MSENITTRILEAIRTGECALFKKATLEQDTHSSKVYSLPSLPVLQLFNCDRPINTSTNFMVISGGLDEALHYHTSHVFGFVVRGEGVFCLRKKGVKRETRLPVSSGDLVVIPRGALHLFECEKGQLEVVTLEVSDRDLDYQSHYSD